MCSCWWRRSLPGGEGITAGGGKGPPGGEGAPGGGEGLPFGGEGITAGGGKGPPGGEGAPGGGEVKLGGDGAAECRSTFIHVVVLGFIADVMP